MELLGDRYRLVDCIGTGGMSVVWQARDEILDRDVVVKLLGPQRPGDTSSRHLIRQEAMAAAGLAHPNVTTVYDYGEVVFPDGETVPYVVMEYVRGRTLSSRLVEGPMPWREAVRMAADVAAALAAAHDRGLVHRDIKPGNVMLTGMGAKVLDFGIAAAVGTRDDGSVLLGTPAYVAPERVAGGPVHPAADVYAVGLLLYKALAGRLPWAASSATQVLRSHQAEPPAPLPEIPGMPPAVRRLCMRCLSRKPGQRPDSATLARRLHEIARTPFGAAPDPDRPDADGHTGPHREAWRIGRNRRITRAVAAGAGLGLAALVLTGSFLPDGGPRGTALTAPRAELGSQPVSCQVRYQARPTDAGRYTARLTVTDTGTAPVTGWALSFPLAAGQRLTRGTGARWSQAGGTAMARHPDGDPGTIAPGGSAELSFQGTSTGDGAPPPPERFTLNGVACGQRDGVLAAADPAAPGAALPTGAAPPAGDPVTGTGGRPAAGSHGNGEHHGGQPGKAVRRPGKGDPRQRGNTGTAAPTGPSTAAPTGPGTAAPTGPVVTPQPVAA